MLERALRLLLDVLKPGCCQYVRKHTMLERALRQLSFYEGKSSFYVVRKHTMLERALRRYHSVQVMQSIHNVRKHTMLERALRRIKTAHLPSAHEAGQKAYNAREGIETSSIQTMLASIPCFSQKAYNAREGIETMLQTCQCPSWVASFVRKHTMLERALRLDGGEGSLAVWTGQKAYNAREGIETDP